METPDQCVDWWRMSGKEDLLLLCSPARSGSNEMTSDHSIVFVRFWKFIQFTVRGLRQDISLDQDARYCEGTSLRKHGGTLAGK